MLPLCGSAYRLKITTVHRNPALQQFLDNFYSSRIRGGIKYAIAVLSNAGSTLQKQHKRIGMSGTASIADGCILTGGRVRTPVEKHANDFQATEMCGLDERII